MFRDLDYHDITTNLAIFKIIISGGSNTKKHILSPVQLRLARFILAISNYSGLEVSNSFHFKRIKNQSRIDWTRKELRSSTLYLNSDEKKNFILDKEEWMKQKKEVNDNKTLKLNNSSSPCVANVESVANGTVIPSSIKSPPSSVGGIQRREYHI